jgi:hypothetical protein
MIHTPETNGCDIGHDSDFGSEFDPHLRVTVIHTTSEGTLEALRLACGLAKDLGVRIAVLAIQLVPFRLSLEQPLVSTNFLRQRLSALAAKVGLGDEEVTLQIYLCRDERQALAKFLPPKSLVVVGGQRGWWRPERRLEKWLARLHHQVIFAGVDKKSGRSLYTRLRSTHCSAPEFLIRPGER